MESKEEARFLWQLTLKIQIMKPEVGVKFHQVVEAWIGTWYICPCRLICCKEKQFDDITDCIHVLLPPFIPQSICGIKGRSQISLATCQLLVAEPDHEIIREAIQLLDRQLHLTLVHTKINDVALRADHLHHNFLVVFRILHVSLRSSHGPSMGSKEDATDCLWLNTPTCLRR